MLPKFLIIGAMKCGTTSMCHYLSQTNDIYVPDEKDIYFFSDDQLYARGIKWYESRFSANPGKAIAGKGTDDYSKVWAHPEAPSRIKKHLPDLKLIYMVRHPLKQIESAYKHRVANSKERLPFNLAIINSDFDYIATADYRRCIEPNRQLFGDDRIRVVFNEDINVDVESEVVSVLSFIGCDTDVSMVKFERMNTSDGKFYDGKIASIFRKSEIVTRLAQSLPDSLKSISKNILTNKKPPDIVWDEAIKKLVIDRLQQNSRTFLKQHGKPEEFWSFK